MKTKSVLNWRRMILLGMAACAMITGMPVAAQEATETAGFSAATQAKLNAAVANEDLRTFIMENAREVTFDEQNRLVGLHFENRGLTYIPSAIGELSDLTKLNLSLNGLTSLPPEISKLTQLTELLVIDNKLTNLPPEIGKLTQLTVLGISDNLLTSLPPEIGNLTQLTFLIISTNHLTSLPPEIGKLTQLTGIFIAGNQLTSLPSELGNLTQLTELDLAGNKLMSLPPEIGKLTRLQRLRADNNQLMGIPPELGKLTQLTMLGLKDNPIKSLPRSLLNLQKLECLEIFVECVKKRNPNESVKDFIERVYPNIVWEGAEAAPKMWAVVVGVAAYQHIRSLRYPDDDAYRVYAFLKSPEGGALPEAQLAVLIDEAAARANILDEMQRLFRQAEADDVILLFFSGHGVGNALVPFDFDGSANLLDHKDIMAILQQSRARHKLVIADACFAGSFDRDLRSLDQTVGNLYNAFASAAGGLALLLSSKAEETSIEREGLRQGVFSYYFIEGLKGAADANHDKIITVTEAFEYINKQVQDYTNYAQNPVLNGNFDPNMPLGAVR